MMVGLPDPPPSPGSNPWFTESPSGRSSGTKPFALWSLGATSRSQDSHLECHHGVLSEGEPEAPDKQL